MEEKIRELFPELEWISDEVLREKVVATYIDALKMGGWKVEDMDAIPFTLNIPDVPFSYLQHVRGVTRMAKAAMDIFNDLYGKRVPGYMMDNDTLVAGALLHDVGKLLEYENDAEGRVVRSKRGKSLRHPFSGAALALQNGCPDEVAHIIATHAREGDSGIRNPEAVLVNKADYMHFDSVKSFKGIR
ncbi:MAG: HD domain-containing protein [Synergistaceae bacterium]|nr:HD domain-containing protein [Synergistaceae bacterium]